MPKARAVLQIIDAFLILLGIVSLATKAKIGLIKFLTLS
jgi:hypothetical protein